MQRLNSNKIKILWLGSGLLFVFFGYLIIKPPKSENIITIESYKELPESILNQRDALIFFDVDDTLISTHDEIANFDFPLLFKLHAFAKYTELLTDSELFEDRVSIIFKDAQKFLIEPLAIDVINRFKKNNNSVLGLTSMESGKFGIIPDIPEWRYNELKSFGIEFSNNYPNETFTELPPYNDKYPVFHNGILYCNRQNKGKIVDPFLKHFNIKPSLIIFFDDEYENLLSVEKTCKKHSIPFIGYHYIGIEKIPLNWNADRAMLQLNSLVKKRRWLTDQEADIQLKNRNSN